MIGVEVYGQYVVRIGYINFVNILYIDEGEFDGLFRWRSPLVTEISLDFWTYCNHTF